MWHLQVVLYIRPTFSFVAYVCVINRRTHVVHTTYVCVLLCVYVIVCMYIGIVFVYVYVLL